MLTDTLVKNAVELFKKQQNDVEKVQRLAQSKAENDKMGKINQQNELNKAKITKLEATIQEKQTLEAQQVTELKSIKNAQVLAQATAKALAAEAAKAAEKAK